MYENQKKNKLQIQDKIGNWLKINCELGWWKFK